MLNRSDRPDDHEYGSYETVVADVADYEPVRDAAEGQDAVIYLAAYPYTDGDWGDVLEPNIIRMYNVLKACRQEEVESIVFGSTHHIMGMYELENVPEIYELESGLVLDHTDPGRPNSFYAATKVFEEALGRTTSRTTSTRNGSTRSESGASAKRSTTTLTATSRATSPSMPQPTRTKRRSASGR